MNKRHFGSAVLVVVAAAIYACGKDATAPPDRIPAALDVLSGQEQSGTVGQELAQPLVVRVTNAAGDPLTGQIVNFRVVKGEGSVFAGAAITNASGVAQERWTLGKSIADSQVVEARAVDPTTGQTIVFARFVATPVAGPAVVLQKVSGDGQAAVAGSALADSLLVRAKDVYDNPVADQPVTWEVGSGQGTLTQTATTTNANGFATTKWTLGSGVGDQTVRAIASADLSTVFTASSQMPPPLVISRNSLERQTASPGTAVPNPPSVLVTDANGAPKAGIPVTFTVTSGGGSVSSSPAFTNAQGVATVDWVLGPQAGTNSLTASLSGGASVTFTATGLAISPDIRVSIVKPAVDYSNLVGDTVPIEVDVTSRLAISSVKVSLAGSTVSLAASMPGVFTGVVVLAGAPRDTMSMVATATDVNGSTAQAISQLFHDTPPRITVTSPSNNSVVRGSLEINATCDDDDPSGCSISVRINTSRYTPPIAGPAPSPFHTTISMAPYDGQALELLFTAQDSRQQTVTVNRTVYIESSTHLSSLGTAPGVIVDASDTRALWASGGTVGITNLGGGSETIVSDPQASIRSGFLTPTGAAFSAAFSVAPYARLYLWRNGSLSTKDLNSTWIAVSGNYLAYTTPPLGSGPLYRTDVTTGTDVLVAQSSGNTDNDVAENGDVAYWTSSYDVVRYRDGTNTPVTTDGSLSNKNVYPLTDGTNIVFIKTATDPGSGGELWLFDGISTSLLSRSPAGQGVVPRLDYEVSGGWTAFTKPDAAAISQVLTRSPAGVLRQVSALGSRSRIRALGSDGSVVFDNAADRYYVGPSGSPVRVSSSLGTVVWRTDHFVTMIGNEAFRLVP